MKMVELYSGSCSMSTAFNRHYWDVYTVDWNPDYHPSLVADISKLDYTDIIKLCDGKPNVIWASPDCTTYSLAGISHHRQRLPDGTLYPISDYAKFCDDANRNLAKMIKMLRPDYWFVENPVGGFRKMGFFPDKYRYTVTYCQYGDNRRKSTDIYTNHPNPQFKPMCKNGDPCHARAPRGSKTGTQGLKGKYERAIIPNELCEHIVNICEQ